MILSPSLLSADCGRLAWTLAELESAGVKWVHWDIMDGRFVPNMTFGQHVVRGLRPVSKLFFDVHLMIEEPERYLADFRDAGAQMLVVHAEATRHLQRTLAEIRRLGMRAGVALNPATPLTALDYVMDDADMVLIMSVNPGFGGQTFLPSTFAKVSALRRKLDAAGRQDCLIQVDGGVNLENAGPLVRAGAGVLVSGSAFFGHPPYRERLESFIKNSFVV
ncbi:ribulose-phosphate 3-epimerase [uncultured Mailhella sp.]|uniref:ribulose-phosphate 3-epimerase n=1 Tax=uncultured Mailhella sp. TaxID=1981031 RepID=UPI00260FBCB8|nr:ribulose-phosphate 3-epimerase [uncultured Mailhella sp.]